jgi:hypothetical protein
MPKTLLSMYPDCSPNRAWLYAVGLPDGSVKVGQTRHPNRRLMTHRRTIGMAWCHLFESGEAPFVASVERRVLTRLAEIGSRTRRTEVFSSVTREQVARVIRETFKTMRSEKQAVQSRVEPDAISAYFQARAAAARLKHEAGLCPGLEDWWLAHFPERRSAKKAT